MVAALAAALALDAAAAGAEAEAAGPEGARGAAGWTAHAMPTARKIAAPRAGSHIGVCGSPESGEGEGEACSVMSGNLVSG